MGNSLGGKKTAKVMKIDGKMMKLKTPVRAGDVVKDHPGHVLLESEAVKYYGIRAKPLEPQQHLKPKMLYFLVELPPETNPRRVRSGIQMSAKDRLETLMLARRSTSDLSLMKPPSNTAMDKKSESGGAVRVKLRLPKAEVEKLMKESKDVAKAAAKIADLYMAANGGHGADVRFSGNNVEVHDDAGGALLQQQHVHWRDDHDIHDILKTGLKSRQKHVGFLPIMEGETQLAMVS